MKYTNNLNLPQPLVSAIANRVYSKGDADYSVTGLLQPAQMMRLKKLHGNELVEDISDNIFAMFGIAIHEVLHKNADSPAENQFIAEYLGKKVSGTYDRYSDGIIQDWKIASVWEYIYGVKPDKIAQLNMYAQILRDNGFTINGLQLVFIFRDWSKRDAKFKSDYPKNQVWVKDIEIWSEEKCKEHIESRIKVHENDTEAECTDEERWAKPEKWAVIKEGAKKAFKLHDSEDSAQAHLETLKGYVIEHRPGENTRCESYCSVSDYCKQWQSIKEKQNK